MVLKADKWEDTRLVRKHILERHMFISTLLLLLIAGVLFSAPAMAMADPCQPLAERLRSIGSAWLKYDLRDRFPRSDAKVLANIGIVQGADENLLGPRWVEANKSIVIPPRYLQTRCHMVFLQLLWLADPNHAYGEVASQTRDCTKTGRGRMTCLDKAIEKLIADVTIDPAKVEWKHTNVELFAMTVFAIRFELAHEAGHILINSRYSSKEIRDLDPEWEADILAEISVVGDSPIIEAPLYAMATASLADPVDDKVHGPTICRLERTRAVVTELGLPALLLSSWDRKKANFAGLPVQSSMKALKKTYLTGPSRTDCEKAGDRRLSDVKSDLDAIMKAIGLHATTRTLEISDPDTANARLASFAPKTASGARIRALLQMELSMQRYDFDAPLAQRGSAARSADFEAYLKQLRDLNSLIGADADSYFRSSELVAILFQKAATEYVMHPAGSSLLKNTSQFLEALGQIDKISPIQEEIRARTFQISLSPAVDAKNISQMLLVRLEVEAGMFLIVGKCDEANRLLQSARSSSGLNASAPISKSQCEIEGKKSGRSFADDRGWVADTP